MLLRCITGLSLLIAAVFFVCMDVAFLMLPLIFVLSWVGLLLLAVLFLCLICSLVDMSVPQEEDSRFYRFFMNLYIEMLVSIARLKVETQGLEKTPEEGGQAQDAAMAAARAE